MGVKVVWVSKVSQCPHPCSTFVPWESWEGKVSRLSKGVLVRERETPKKSTDSQPPLDNYWTNQETIYGALECLAYVHHAHTHPHMHANIHHLETRTKVESLKSLTCHTQCFQFEAHTIVDDKAAFVVDPLQPTWHSLKVPRVDAFTNFMYLSNVNWISRV